MGEVIIDGVVFVFDETGTKLVKKPHDANDSSAPSSAELASGASSSKHTDVATSPSKAPLRTSINGQSFVRTKRGNLISAELLEQRRAQKQNATKLKRLAKMGQQIGQTEKIRYVGSKNRETFDDGSSLCPPLFRSANRKPSSTQDSHHGNAPKGLCTFFTKTGLSRRSCMVSYFFGYANPPISFLPLG